MPHLRPFAPAKLGRTPIRASILAAVLGGISLYIYTSLIIFLYFIDRRQKGFHHLIQCSTSTTFVQHLKCNLFRSTVLQQLSTHYRQAFISWNNKGVTKRCGLSWLSNSALVWVQMRGERGEGLRGLSQWVLVQLCTWSPYAMTFMERHWNKTMLAAIVTGFTASLALIASIDKASTCQKGKKDWERVEWGSHCVFLDVGWWSQA